MIARLYIKYRFNPYKNDITNAYAGTEYMGFPCGVPTAPAKSTYSGNLFSKLNQSPLYRPPSTNVKAAEGMVDLYHMPVTYPSYYNLTDMNTYREGQIYSTKAGTVIRVVEKSDSAICIEAHMSIGSKWIINSKFLEMITTNCQCREIELFYPDQAGTIEIGDTVRCFSQTFGRIVAGTVMEIDHTRRGSGYKIKPLAGHMQVLYKDIDDLTLIAKGEKPVIEEAPKDFNVWDACADIYRRIYDEEGMDL